jgi:nucleotide-binding universal stress UspA family protein
MKTILFPTDFSKNALHAAQYAGMLARSMNARVVLLNVHAPISSNFKKEDDSRKDIAQSRQEAEVDMKKFTAKFIEKSLLCPERIIQCVEYSTSVSQKIVEKAKSINAHFIVMGTKGASNIINKWIGTNAQKVMKTAHCPVWIIPEHIEIIFPHKIMYAADLKEDEFLATTNILQILEPLGVICKVIHIHDFLSLKSGSKVKELVGSLRQEFKDENVIVRKIDRTDIIEGLESYIKLYKPDVLSLAIHEKSIFEKIFETSVTKYFVQNPQLPILTFRK